jgi:putative transposase
MTSDNTPYFRRRSLRLQGYDYSQAGAYYVTVCTHDRALLFGTVYEGQVQLSEAGRCVVEQWEDLPNRYPTISLDAFVVMPNHIHGIIVLSDVSTYGIQPRQDSAATKSPTLSAVLRAYKSLSAIAANKAMGRTGRPLWQQGFYDEIIRSERALNRIREYIEANPWRWSEDTDNPANW